MADYLDDDGQVQPNLGSDLSGAGMVAIVPQGMADDLSKLPTLAPPAVAVVVPQAVTAGKVPGYISSETGKFVPLLSGVSPGAFAAQQQSPWENLLSGYGAETMNFGREAADLTRRAVAAVQGNAGAPSVQNPNRDIDKALFKTSPAADIGRIGADFVNTMPAAGVAGELAAPIAESIQGESLLPSISRAAMPGVAKGVTRAIVIPADDTDERLHHILIRGSIGARNALPPILRALANY
ncbi:MAG TPA: hypothetical protein VGM16_09180 [Gammaproteobacteria bacterium]|jgi:hypothetical protein